jgi:hypothetical protein
MDFHIESELQQSMNLPESELDITYMCFLDYMKEWWQYKNFFLQDTISRENDSLRKTSENLRTILKANSMIRDNPNLTNSTSNSPQKQT